MGNEDDNLPLIDGLEGPDDTEIYGIRANMNVDHDGHVIEDAQFDVRHHLEIPLFRCPLDEDDLQALQAYLDPKDVEIQNFFTCFLHVKDFVTRLMLHAPLPVGPLQLGLIDN